MSKPIDWFKYPCRICKSLHECAICGRKITYGEQYLDGGYGRRAHLNCANNEREKQLADSACPSQPVTPDNAPNPSTGSAEGS